MPYEILLQHVSIVPCLCVFGISHFGLYYLYSSTNFNNAEDEEKQTIEITEKLDGKNGGYIWGELLVDPISRKYFSTKLYEDEKREKERAIAELNQVKKLYGQVIDTNKQLREQIQLLDRNINVYKNKLSGYEAKLRVTEQENTEIKSSFWYKLFGKK